MTNSELKNDKSPDVINEKLISIESRLSEVEKIVEAITNIDLNTGNKANRDHEGKDSESDFSSLSSNSIESVIGEYGLAWIGNIVLLFGLTFLTQYLQNKGYILVSSAVGYISVLSIFVISYLIQASYANMAKMFTFLGHFLLYYFTFRLYFISDPPLLNDKTICIALLLAVNIFQFYFSIKRESTILGGIGLILTLTTAILSDSTHVMLPITTAVAAASAYLLYRFGWRVLLVLAQVLVYLTILIWFIHNPIMGHTAEIVKSHEFCYIYLLSIATIYSMIMFIPQKEKITNDFINASIIFNGLGFTFILALLVTSFFPSNYSFIFTAIFLIGFSFSIVLKIKSSWRSSHALYALYSFVALSVAIYGIYKLPNTFLLLSIESILVIAVALWFRSRLIVILNTGLYLLLLTTYIIISDPVNGINFSFALVALVSAIILKRQQTRLAIKTSFLENIYLITAFFLVLYSFYKALPGQYVTLSWIFIAILYFMLSMLVRNAKYRWMSIGTFIATAIYLFVVDLARIEMTYRIVAFLALAIITIVISIIYTKRKKSSS
jgi:hypothetical protein